MAKIIKVYSLDAPELQVYTSLTDIQLRNRLEPEKGLFIAQSPKVIKVALEAGHTPVSFLVEEQMLDGQAAPILEAFPDVPVYTASRELLSRLTGFPLTRGLLCAMKRPACPAVEDICRNARRIAVLEGVCDYTNIGAIFRSAAALNVDAVLLTPTCCDPLNRRAIRVSMGTVFLVPWTYIGEESDDWPHPGMEQLRKLGFKTASMALRRDTVSISDPVLQSEEKLAILLGTEGEGLLSETISCSDYTIKIPMAHDVDSLNVAAASAVAFWELCN